MDLFIDILFEGISIGSVLLIAALGLAIVFGLMGVINLAHGELIMVGAYSTFVTQLLFKQPFLKPFYGSYIIVSIFVAFIFSACVGILLERLIIRKLYGSPLETLLATWGVSLLLQQFVRGVPLAVGPGIIITFISSQILIACTLHRGEEILNMLRIKRNQTERKSMYQKAYFVLFCSCLFSTSKLPDDTPCLVLGVCGFIKKKTHDT